MQQSELIDRHQLRRLYQMNITGVYANGLLDDIISKMRYILGKMKGTVGSVKLLELCTKAKTDTDKMMAIDTVIHKTHTSGFYAQHLIQGKDKIDIMNFLAELAGIDNKEQEKRIVEQLRGTSTVPGHALYSTIDLIGFEELNKTAIRDTRARFAAMNIKEYSFSGKTLLDIGCNVGHMLFEATTCGFPISYGIEKLPDAVAAGKALADYLRVSDRINIQMANADISQEQLKALTGLEQFDIVFSFAVDGYVRDVSTFYKRLVSITKEVLYFEPNNHKIDWNADFIKSWGFKTVEKVTVPYDKSTGSTRNCFICYK